MQVSSMLTWLAAHPGLVSPLLAGEVTGEGASPLQGRILLHSVHLAATATPHFLHANKPLSPITLVSVKPLAPLSPTPPVRLSPISFVPLSLTPLMRLRPVPFVPLSLTPFVPLIPIPLVPLRLVPSAFTSLCPQQLVLQLLPSSHALTSCAHSSNIVDCRYTSLGPFMPTAAYCKIVVFCILVPQ